MRTIVLATSVALLSGCVGAGGFQAKLSQRRGEVMYLHEARAIERRPGTVSLASFTVDEGLPPETTVEKTGGFVVPALLVNLWKAEYRSRLGAAQVTNDYRAFMKDSLAEALKRSAAFGFAERDGDLQLDVRVTKVAMTAPIAEGGNFLFLLIAFSYGKWTSAGPVDVAVEGEVVVRQRGVEVLRKPVEGKARTGIMKGKQAKVEELTLAMIEGLSLAVKGFNDAAVREVNALAPVAAPAPAPATM